MRRRMVMICLVLFGVVISCVVLKLSNGTKRSILIADTFLPPLAVGEIDIFGEQPSSSKPEFLSAEEFRDRFKSEDIATLLQTGTLANLREKFGEPLEYNRGRNIFPQYDLPPWFRMEYPTGIVLSIKDNAVVQVDLREPGYVIKDAIQVGAALEDIYRSVGEPEKLHDMSGDRRGHKHAPLDYKEIPPGSIYFDEFRKYYRPKDANMLLFFNQDKITEISVWRDGPIPHPQELDPRLFPHFGHVTFLDTSGRPGYLRSKGKECRENLAQLGLPFREYTNESLHDLYPTLASEPGSFAFNMQDLFPKYLDNPAFLDCPAMEKEDGAGAPHAPGGQKIPDYWYFGYCMVDEREGVAFLTAYYDHVIGKKPFEQHLPVPKRALSGTSGVLYQLGEGVERLYITEIGTPLTDYSKWMSLIPILVERPGHHSTPGGHVLYMDGHVEWLPYPGPFPMTPAFIEGVKAVEERLCGDGKGNETVRAGR